MHMYSRDFWWETDIPRSLHRVGGIVWFEHSSSHKWAQVSTCDLKFLKFYTWYMKSMKISLTLRKSSTWYLISWMFHPFPNPFATSTQFLQDFSTLCLLTIGKCTPICVHSDMPSDKPPVLPPLMLHSSHISHDGRVCVCFQTLSFSQYTDR